MFNNIPNDNDYVGKATQYVQRRPRLVKFLQNFAGILIRLLLVVAAAGVFVGLVYLAAWVIAEAHWIVKLAAGTIFVLALAGVAAYVSMEDA